MDADASGGKNARSLKFSRAFFEFFRSESYTFAVTP